MTKRFSQVLLALIACSCGDSGTSRPADLVNFGKIGIDGIAGTQGNSHLHAVGGPVRAVFTDDEFDEGGDHGEISVHVLESGSFPNGTWSKTVLPAAVNTPAPETRFNPFLVTVGDRGLYFTRLGEGQTPAIRYAAYSGLPDINMQAGFIAQK